MSSGNNTSVSQVGQSATVNLTTSLTGGTSTIYTTYVNTNNIFFSNNCGISCNGYRFYFNGSNFVMSDWLKVPLNTPGTGGATVRWPSTSGGILSQLSSSQRYKTNIEPLLDTDSILNIQPVYFNYKDASGNALEKKYLGFIAEQMAENELGNYFVVKNDDNTIETINYDLLVPLYSSALRTLKTRLNNLISDFETLKENQKIKIASYEERINALEIIKQNQESQ